MSTVRGSKGSNTDSGVGPDWNDGTTIMNSSG